MATKQNARSGPSRLMGLIPTWKTNLALFGLFIVIALGYFYWQVQQAHNSFLEHAGLNSGIVASVIEHNTKSASFSREIVLETMQAFLGNMARFVGRLDDIEPFSPEELTSFAQEAGLAGICIEGDKGRYTEGPSGWLPDPAKACGQADGLIRHRAETHVYYLADASLAENGCIIVGIASGRFEKLQEQIGLPYLLNTLSGLGGIRYVRIEAVEAPKGKDDPSANVAIVQIGEQKIAETRRSMGDKVLVLGLAAEHLVARIAQLWREFFIFSAFLAAVGIFFSWLLHRLQTAYLNQVRHFERQMARQHEDAALGRSAASIAHEIRNPLNSISMGLQRLKIESRGMSTEHERLVDTMLKAVDRTDGIVEDIRRYARPLNPRFQPVRLDALIENQLTLFAEQCRSQNIQIDKDVTFKGAISGDSALLEEAFENLIKNGIEAQAEGGLLRIGCHRRGSDAMVSVENSGFSLPVKESSRILEPYFTTKTRGTGLGLSIVQRIVTAHGGRLALDVPRDGWLTMSVYLPVGAFGGNQ